MVAGLITFLIFLINMQKYDTYPRILYKMIYFTIKIYMMMMVMMMTMMMMMIIMIMMAAAAAAPTAATICEMYLRVLKHVVIQVKIHTHTYTYI